MQMHPDRPLDASNFPRTNEVLHEGLQRQVASAIFGGWASRRGSYSLSLGRVSNLPNALALTPQTRFDIASLTKVMATVPLVARLIERRWLDWETPIQEFFPERSHLRGITLKHLLSHTAGFTAWMPFFEKVEMKAPVLVRQNQMRELVLSVPPENRPGEVELYSDISFLILGFLLERILEQGLDQACQGYVFEPMGLRDTGFGPISRSVAVATEDHPKRGLIQGEVHDDNCWAMGGVAGHAGLFSTGSDVLRFGQWILNGKFFSEDTLRHFWTKPYSVRTYGWDGVSGEGSSVGRNFSRQSIGHLGFTGTSLWIDPESQIVAVLLTNRVHPSRENTKIKEFRIAFHEALREDLIHGEESV